METSSTDQSVWHVTMYKAGRVLLPAPLRHELGAPEGTPLIWTKEDNGVRLETYEQSLKRIQDYYRSLGLEDVIWSEELITRRRLEAVL